jgi:hypothetical protein
MVREFEHGGMFSIVSIGTKVRRWKILKDERSNRTRNFCMDTPLTPHFYTQSIKTLHLVKIKINKFRPLLLKILSFFSSLTNSIRHPLSLTFETLPSLYFFNLAATLPPFSPWHPNFFLSKCRSTRWWCDEISLRITSQSRLWTFPFFSLSFSVVFFFFSMLVMSLLRRWLCQRGVSPTVVMRHGCVSNGCCCYCFEWFWWFSVLGVCCESRRPNLFGGRIYYGGGVV